MTDRVVRELQLPAWGRVCPCPQPTPWLVVDDRGRTVEPIRLYLVDCAARGMRPGTLRSYAYALLRWWRWLRVLDVPWNRATSAEVRDLVLWLGCHPKPIAARRTASRRTVGTVNAATGKPYLSDGYAARTIRHGNAVISSFYEFWSDAGDALILNPVAKVRGNVHRPNAHHNPVQTFQPPGRVRYNPRLPKQTPRAMSDAQWNTLFSSLRTDRDRALLALAVSNGARAAEILGIRYCDFDWGEQTVRVHRKGTGTAQWLPVSPEALIWLRLYLRDSLTQAAPMAPIWRTARRRDRGSGLQLQPLSYDTLRAVLRRANATLSTNWSMHDLRHTCAQRMSRDRSLTLRDVQVILGHAHLSTTADIYLVEEQRLTVERVAEHLARDRTSRADRPVPVTTALAYDADDLNVLFGKASS